MKQNNNNNLPSYEKNKSFQAIQTILKIGKAFDDGKPIMVSKYLCSFVKEYPGFAYAFFSTSAMSNIIKFTNSMSLVMPSFEYTPDQKEMFIEALLEVFKVDEGIRLIMNFPFFKDSISYKNDNLPAKISVSDLIQITSKILKVAQAFDNNQPKKVEEYHDSFTKEDPNFASMFFFTSPAIVQTIKLDSIKNPLQKEKALYIDTLCEVFGLSPAIRAIIKLPAFEISEPHKNDKVPLYVSPEGIIHRTIEDTSNVDYVGDINEHKDYYEIS